MVTKLDSQGWVDAMHKGRAFAYIVRDDMLWVRYEGKYKYTQLSRGTSMIAARALASFAATEDESWVDEAVAKRAGLPSE